MKVRLGSVNLMVRFGSGSVVKIFEFGSVRNGLRMVFEFSMFGSGLIRFPSLVYSCIIPQRTRMWADAQRDGRPAEYRWRPIQKFGNSTPCTTPQNLAEAAAGVPCSNAANIGERKTWT